MRGLAQSNSVVPSRLYPAPLDEFARGGTKKKSTKRIVYLGPNNASKKIDTNGSLSTTGGCYRKTQRLSYARCLTPVGLVFLVLRIFVHSIDARLGVYYFLV